MTVTLSMKDLSEGLRLRAEYACARAETMRAHAVEVAAQLSLMHERQWRMRVHAQPPQSQAHKLRLAVALQQEQAGLRELDRQVRTQWLLQKGAGAQPTRSRMH